MWKLKVLIQFILSHLPFGEQVNYQLQLLNKSHSPEKIGVQVLELARKMKLLDQYVDLENSTVVEVGTGWDPISALLLYLHGAKAVYTYDHVPHVRYRSVRQVINQIEVHIDDIQSITSLPTAVLRNRLARLRSANTVRQVFQQAGIVYNAPGDATHTGLPDDSVDLVYSYAVLEHVPEQVIADLTMESKRILKDGGIAYHAIGFGDHYSFDKSISNVNFLRYPEWLWAFFVKNKISYHNRLREKQMLDIFTSNGASVEWIVHVVEQSDLDDLKTMKIVKRFAGMTHEQLAVSFADIIMSFRGASYTSSGAANA